MNELRSILLVGSDGEPIFYSPKAEIKQISDDTFEVTDRQWPIEEVFASFDRLYLDSVIDCE